MVFAEVPPNYKKYRGRQKSKPRADAPAVAYHLACKIIATCGTLFLTTLVVRKINKRMSEFPHEEPQNLVRMS